MGCALSHNTVYPRLTRTHTVLAGRKNAHTSSKTLKIHKVFPAAFSSSGRLSASAKLLAPDSDGFSCDFWLLRRRCVVTPRNQIKAQQSGFDLKRKKERAKCSFRRKAETEWRKFLLTMRKGQKAPERHAVRRMCSCQPRVLYTYYPKKSRFWSQWRRRISRATYTPLAEACDSECVTPEPSPMTYSPSAFVWSLLSSSTSML